VHTAHGEGSIRKRRGAELDAAENLVHDGVKVDTEL
jgi:hypothetical protein